MMRGHKENQQRAIGESALQTTERKKSSTKGKNKKKRSWEWTELSTASKR